MPEIVHFAGHTARLPAPPPSRSPSVSSVWACVPCLAWSALYLERPALPPVVCSPSGCAGGWGIHLGGMWPEARVGAVSPVSSDQNKKGVLSLPTPFFLRKTPIPHCQSQKFRRKNKKTPTNGLCSVLYLPYKP